MKRFLLFAVLLMAGIGSAMAQSIDGSWKANQEFKKMFDLKDSDGTDLDLLLVFKGSKMDIKLLIEAKDGEVGVIKMSYTIPGSFKKSGNTYATTFNKEKAEFKVVDVVTTNPEMKEMMKDPDSKQMVLNLIEAMVKKDSSNGFEDMAAIIDVFEEFEVASVTAKKLELKIAKALTIGLDRQ